ncbi:MAG TPA: kelch repeat-containing protein [Phycisphaerae bacterium]|nr:kelch repeat-containing protein [Phycisphaerae bacterium]
MLTLLPLATMAVADASAPLAREIAVRVAEIDGAGVGVLSACAYDSKRGRLLIFGGSESVKSKTRAGVLSIDLATMRSSVIEVAGPGPRGTGGPGMVYVPGEDALYLFGGWPRDAEKPVAELWVLGLGADAKRSWQLVSDGSEGPPARNGCAMVADAERNRLLVHGGDGGPTASSGFNSLDDLWAFDLKARKWHRLRPTGAVPPERWNHAVAIDPERNRMFIFGGVGYAWGRALIDREVFMLDLEGLVWTKLPGGGDPPPPMEGTSLTYDAEHDLLMLAGGLSLAETGPPGPRSVWSYDLKDNTWTRHEDAMPSTRQGHVGVYDPVGKSHVIVGGETAQERGNFYARGRVLSEVLAIRIGAEQGPGKGS